MIGEPVFARCPIRQIENYLAALEAPGGPDQEAGRIRPAATDEIAAARTGTPIAAR